MLNPKDNLINVENGTEEAENNLTEELFFLSRRTIKEKMTEYNPIPTKKFINESYFLYDKSFLIKKTFVTALNKQLSLYGSFSYFSGKTAATSLKLLSSNDFLKFLVEKKSLRENLKFQLAHVDGSDVETSDKKIHNFSITKLGKRRKTIMSEPIETTIIRTQQNFDVVGGLNPIQTEI